MRFHDYHLAGYSVREFGREILLHLVWPYETTQQPDSYIQFSDVATYHFIHTGGAIITDIEEVAVGTLLNEQWKEFTERFRQFGGYHHWSDDRAHYQRSLEAEGYRAWYIESAIGFSGFVIARAAAQVAES